ncbi:MAG: Response regulator receiver domain, partial [Myxococcaceae bacterium]|nr:Response regulator receiver domain [Myxococcaceae bacterium]
ASWGAAIAVIIVSGSSREANVADALAAGAFGFISKPFLDAEILAALGGALGLVYG